MKTFSRRRGLITEINVTPLVDIVLVLLIVFMLTAHLIAKQAIEVNLPRAASGESPPASLAVTLTRDGTLYLDGRPTTATALRDAVAAAVARDPRAGVIVAADTDVAHGRVVWVLDLVKTLGVTSFSIQIDPLAVTPPG